MNNDCLKAIIFTCEIIINNLTCENIINNYKHSLRLSYRHFPFPAGNGK